MTNGIWYIIAFAPIDALPIYNFIQDKETKLAEFIEDTFTLNESYLKLQEEFDDIAYLNVNYYRDFVKQVEEDTTRISTLENQLASALNRISALETLVGGELIIMGKPKKKLSYRAKLNLLRGGSILATITPLGIVMFLNKKEYFATTNRVKLSTGLILTLLVIIFVVFKKLKLQKIVWLAIVFGIAVFFESIFKDIVLLSGALLAGGAIDEILFARPIKRLEKLVDYKEQADVQKEAQKEVNKELIEGLAEAIRSGRV